MSQQDHVSNIARCGHFSTSQKVLTAFVPPLRNLACYRSSGRLLKSFFGNLPACRAFATEMSGWPVRAGCAETAGPQPAPPRLASLDKAIDLFVGGQEQRGDLTAFAGPVEQRFLFERGELIRCIVVLDVLSDATRRIAEQESFDADRLGGLVHRPVGEVACVNIEERRRLTENRFVERLTRPDR